MGRQHRLRLRAAANSDTSSRPGRTDRCYMVDRDAHDGEETTMLPDWPQGPGEEGLPTDEPETSEPGWDLEVGHVDDVPTDVEGETLEELVSEHPEQVEGLGEPSDPVVGYPDDFPEVA